MESIIGRIVNLFDERIEPSQIFFENGRIVRISPLTDVHPIGLPYIIPGLVDAHIHIESTLMTPANYARLAVQHGVTACVTDPHEIANVLGEKGIDFMMRSAESTMMKIRFCLPSCVPSTEFETAGARIDAHQTAKLLSSGRFIALAEMMNYPGVLAHDAEVMTKLTAAREAGIPTDGHAPMLKGTQAEQYIAAGISTDHEVANIETARERIALGQKILIREGSAARNFEALVHLLSEPGTRGQLMFCSDDLYPDEFEEGYIMNMVRRAIRDGASLYDALWAATIAPAKHYGLDLGLLMTGEAADFVVVDSIDRLNVLATYIDGRCVFDGRDEHVMKPNADEANNEEMPNNFHPARIKASDLHIELTGKRFRVIGAWDGELFTSAETTDKLTREIQKLVVLNRYREAKPAIGYIRGFNLSRGAIASTVAHDSHNIIAVGCNDEDISVAINHLEDTKGGLVAVADGRVIAEMALPVAGLMSDRLPRTAINQFRAMKLAVSELGCTMHAPFMTLAFMALPVIPELKLTDLGLFDVRRFAFTGLTTD